MLYKKPEIKSYSAGDLLEEFGPCQGQYTTVTLNTISGSSGINIDGWAVSTTANSTANEILAGDNGFNMGFRGLLGFDLSSIPTGSTIVSATLRAYQVSIASSPYADLGGAIRTDVIDFGTSLDAADYSSAALNSNIGNISTDATIGEWKTLDVTSYVQSRLSGGNIQFRLYFPAETDSDGVADTARFSSADSLLNIPELVVTYK